MLRRISQRLASYVGAWLADAEQQASARRLPTFAHRGSGLTIAPPWEIRNADRIELGNGVKLGAGSVLNAATAYPGPWLAHPDGRHVTQTFDPHLRIGNGVTATGGLHVQAFSEIVIEDDVMFARNVFVADGTHARTVGDVPYKFQGIADVAPIHIGRGAWIGNNVVVMPGVSIGAYAIVGANSVVTRDVPAGSVAVGAPARTVQTWDPEARTWMKASPSGTSQDPSVPTARPPTP